MSNVRSHLRISLSSFRQRPGLRVATRAGLGLTAGSAVLRAPLVRSRSHLCHAIAVAPQGSRPIRSNPPIEATSQSPLRRASCRTLGNTTKMDSARENFFVITGASGSSKSSIIEELGAAATCASRKLGGASSGSRTWSRETQRLGRITRSSWSCFCRDPCRLTPLCLC